MENDSIDELLDKYVTEKTYKLLAGSKANLADSMFRYSPSAYIPVPTTEDYENGMFFRYFTRKTNNLNATPIEISKDEYFEKANPSPFLMSWTAIFSSMVDLPIPVFPIT